VVLLVAFEGAEHAGFALAYVLRRRHGDGRQLFLYEIEVAKRHRRRGVATDLLRSLQAFAVASGIGRGFVLTERDNVAAMSLYRSVGAREERDDVVWEIDYTAR
jgi:aminoglycoside 3-N-acetyltransferase I